MRRHARLLRYGHVTQRLMSLGKPVVVILEGGYDLLQVPQ